MEEGTGCGASIKMKRATVLFALVVPSSLRDRKRYLVFELLSEREIREKGLLKEIRNAIFSLYGDVGASECRMRLIEYRKEEGRKEGAKESTEIGRGILRCAHGKAEEVRAALASIYSLDGVRVSIRVIGISGTIKGAMRLQR